MLDNNMVTSSISNNSETSANCILKNLKVPL